MNLHYRKKLSLFVCCSLVSCVVSRANELELNPNVDCQAMRGEPVTYEYDYRVIVTPPYHTKKLRVWLPIPPSNEVQQYELLSSETFPLSAQPEMGTEPKFGNQFAYFEFDDPKGAQIIRRRFRVTTCELNWNIDESRVQKVSQWPDAFDPYLSSDTSVAVTPELRTELNRFLPKPTRKYRDLTTAIRWVEDNLEYDHSNASLQASSTHALENRTGHCSDYHGLCSAFGRALGYPTRVTYGLAGFEKNSPSHCKLEAFVPGYGWVSYDVSETQKLIKKVQAAEELSDEEKQQLIEAARKRLRRGFRDNTWIKQTVGTDYDLVPQASQPVKVVRTIYAEADGFPLPEPDPADQKKREFSWMTAHRVTASRKVSYPFKDIARLRQDAIRFEELNQ